MWMIQDNGLSILPPPASIDLGMCASPPRNQPSDDRNHGCGPPLTAGVVEFILLEACVILVFKHGDFPSESCSFICLRSLVDSR
jgi:hypothetical protein